MTFSCRLHGCVLVQEAHPGRVPQCASLADFVVMSSYNATYPSDGYRYRRVLKINTLDALDCSLERVKSMDTSLREQLRKVDNIATKVSPQAPSKACELRQAYTKLAWTSKDVAGNARVAVDSLRQLIAISTKDDSSAVITDLGDLLESVDLKSQDVQKLVNSSTFLAEEISVLGSNLDEDIENVILSKKHQHEEATSRKHTLEEANAPQTYWYQPNWSQVKPKNVHNVGLGHKKAGGNVSGKPANQPDLQQQLSIIERVDNLRIDVIAQEVAELVPQWEVLAGLYHQLAIKIRSVQSVLQQQNDRTLEDVKPDWEPLLEWLERCSGILESFQKSI
ncbi:unnamed protein product [Somion occarium]|uniref:Uncharacterized protein n=1 Tax=Somion occarium TaxID=3059160 RepID=A0ABP1E7S0_9APHY